MDASILSVGTQEWISNTIVPILTIVIPVWVFLSTSHKAAMKSKVDKEVYENKIKSIEDSIKDVKIVQNDYANTQSEILDKVTDIWKFLADMKSKGS